jgi:hypothetical protein
MPSFYTLNRPVPARHALIRLSPHRLHSVKGRRFSRFKCLINIFLAGQRPLQQHGHMHRIAPGAILDLVPAREAIGHNRRIGRG